ncbi:MAG: aldehyde dehydrogenase family protein [Flavisolibacter sp.]|nr:aldehyde dehydrogenase family protein [Flavisolibacter sp.]
METIENKVQVNKESTNGLTHIAKNWIDGAWMDAEKHSISYNPATGEQIGKYADGSVEEAQKAVAAALRAFRKTPWKNDHALRTKVLLAMADGIEARRDELTQIVCGESGKIMAEAAIEGFVAPAYLRYWAGKTFVAGRAGAPKAGSISITLREAAGVAGIIAPFNAPVGLALRSLGPALAAGCTTVIKLPGITAQANEVFSKVISEVPDLPPGVINLITESGNDVAKFLVQSPDVPVISFTGSTKTGRAIVAEGAAQLKRFNMELGGKTPMIVFKDADVETAAFTIEKAITFFSGQFCMTGSRILVQKEIAERVRQGLAERLTNVKVGPASDPSSEMGAMIDKANVQRVNGIVEEAIAAGAKVIVRGGPITEGDLSKGAFYRPTLLEITDPDLPIVQQEVFGPVATLQVFDTEAEAIALANNSEYGLAASIWSRDIDTPWRVAKALQAGTIWINAYAQMFAEFEEGGYKQSGIGRLNGEAALDAFLEYKHISFHPGLLSEDE